MYSSGLLLVKRPAKQSNNLQHYLHSAAAAGTLRLEWKNSRKCAKGSPKHHVRVLALMTKSASPVVKRLWAGVRVVKLLLVPLCFFFQSMLVLSPRWQSPIILSWDLPFDLYRLAEHKIWRVLQFGGCPVRSLSFIKWWTHAFSSPGTRILHFCIQF